MPPITKKKRSGPYMWEYRSVAPSTWGIRKKVRSRKRIFRGENLPQSVLNLISGQLGRNVGRLHVASPSHMRHVSQPHFNRQRKVEKLRNLIRGRLARRINPSYIQIVQRLATLNRTPNNNYEMRNQTSTGWHTRRIQNMQNLLGRLQLQGTNRYYNAQRNNTYMFNDGKLVFSPNDPRRPNITIAYGLKRRANGTLYFNTRRRKQQLRNRTR